jgi:hypothetical protein
MMNALRLLDKPLVGALFGGELVRKVHKAWSGVVDEGTLHRSDVPYGTRMELLSKKVAQLMMAS